MKTYELTYLIAPENSTEDIESLRDKIKTFIQEKGGSINKANYPTKRILAYPIKKQREAFLADLVFLLEPLKLPELEKKLKTEKQILRHLIITKKISKETLKPKVKPKKILKPKTKEAKVELKEIEKKLEEILGE